MFVVWALVLAREESGNLLSEPTVIYHPAPSWLSLASRATPAAGTPDGTSGQTPLGRPLMDEVGRTRGARDRDLLIV